MEADLEDLLRQAGLTSVAVADLLRSLAKSPLAQPAEITAVIPTGATSVTVRHGLPRAASGAFVIAATDASRTVSVDIPTSPTTLVVRISSAASSDFTVKLRAF